MLLRMETTRFLAPLYFYVKKAHVGVVPGIEGFLKEFTAESTWGEEGYLADKGMIPLDEEKREAMGNAVRSLQLLAM